MGFTISLVLVLLVLSSMEVVSHIIPPALQVTDSNGRIILFIDEIHTVVGAGATGESGLDAGALGSVP